MWCANLLSCSLAKDMDLNDRGSRTSGYGDALAAGSLLRRKVYFQGSSTSFKFDFLGHLFRPGNVLCMEVWISLFSAELV